MRYLSVCAGIEAATVAWHPLGWEAAAFSEIEAFPRAVLAHHYPEVPLHGDFTTIGADDYGAIDILVGGTPCQSFSIAGLRGGLGDDRGNLALEFLRLADRKRPRWVVWENVPGVFSSLSHDAPDLCPPNIDLDAGDGPADGEEVVVEDSYDADESHSFSCFLAGLSELGYGVAYRVLDAQFAGVPQRRRRVFAVGYLGDWRRAAAVLFERHSLSGHPAPRREAREGTAARTARSVAIRGRDGVPQAELGDDIANAILTPNGGRAGVGCGAILEAFGGGNTSGPIDIATAQTAHGVRMDFDTETFVTHSLRGEGFDASEDGTGRGTPLVPVAFDCKGTQVQFTTDGIHPTLRSMGHANSHSNAGGHAAVAYPLQEVGKRTGVSTDDVRAGIGIGGAADPMFTLQASAQHGVAFAENSRAELRLEGGDGNRTGALSTGGGKPGQGVPMIAGSAVRRLTPRECERLQGFPDDYTLIPVRGKSAADGPRYKALGNSMAVPVMAWLGQRIQMVEDLSKEMSDAA